MQLRVLRERLFPPVPEPVRDEFMIRAALEAQIQSRPLLLALLITVPPVAFASAEGASVWARYGLPALMGLGCVIGLIANFQSTGRITSARRARRMITDSTVFSSFLALVCSAWCVFSFLGSPDDTRPYYPLILAMGSLSTAYCLSSARLAAILNLSIGLLPISAILLFSGDQIQLAAGVSLMVAAIFLLQLVVKRHAQLVDLLMLKMQMRELASTDPLTGLLNRRALSERLDATIEAAQEAEGAFALVLIDLDGFKPVNDTYGHAMGDRLLCSVAERLRAQCADTITVARLGGDEFALIAPYDGDHPPEALPAQLLTALVLPHALEGHVIRVGASLGVAHWPADGADARDLFEAADRALYAAKDDGRAPRSAGDRRNRRAAA